MTIPEALEIGMQHHRAGRFAEAEATYRQILAMQPEHPDALHLLGVIAYQVGRGDLGVDLIGRAIALAPPNPILYSNLGEAHRSLGRNAEAVDCYRQALTLAPEFAEAASNMSLALRAAGRIAEAIDAAENAVALRPESPSFLSNLGLALQDAGRFDEAVDRFRRALAIEPSFPEAAYNLANVLYLLGEADEAVVWYERALSLRPQYPEALNNLGNVHKDRDQLDKAADCYVRALEIQPRHVASHVNLGNVFKELAQLDTAIEHYRHALAIQPDCLTAHSNVVYSLHFHPDHDDESIAAEHARWNRQFADPLKPVVQPHVNDRDPDRRLRIGYVSPDFRFQSEAFFVVPLLEAHDRRAFEIHCYASVVRPDDVTARLRRSADVWHDVRLLSDADLAEQIRRDEIDVLVDLTMHMACNRLLTFARKPAPVQVAWLAYPGSTGLETMDYRITDGYLDPPGFERPHDSEKAIRLPDCWVCYDPLATEPAVNSSPAADAKHVTFGCMNNFCKVNAPTLDLWARVLREVKGSRLILLAPEGSPRRLVLDRMNRYGVAGERIEFVGRTSRPDYLRLHHRIDVALDTLPYNGITTTCDALWMGVPVVSLAGRTAAGRAGLGILSIVGLADLAAPTPDDFVRAAAQLAGDVPRLAALRAELRGRLQSSPLMDGPRFARNLENAYRSMCQWRRSI